MSKNLKPRLAFLSFVLGVFSIPATATEHHLSTIANMKDVALFIQTRAADGSGKSGTAFEITYTTNAIDYAFLITAKHVMEGAVSLVTTYPYSKAEMANADRPLVQMELDVSGSDRKRVYFAPDGSDVAAIYIGKLGEDFPMKRSASISGSITLQNAKVSNVDLGALPSQSDLPEIFVTGYAWGMVNGRAMPVSRRCTIALESTVGLSFGRKGEALIDCKTLPGDSGAPVFSKDIIVSDEGRIIRTEQKIVGILLGSFTKDATYDLEDEVILKKFPSGFSRIATSSLIDQTLQTAVSEAASAKKK